MKVITALHILRAYDDDLRRLHIAADKEYHDIVKSLEDVPADAMTETRKQACNAWGKCFGFKQSRDVLAGVIYVFEVEADSERG